MARRQVLVEIGLAHANRTSANANPMMWELPGLDELIDARGAHVEDLGDVSNSQKHFGNLSSDGQTGGKRTVTRFGATVLTRTVAVSSGNLGLVGFNVL